MIEKYKAKNILNSKILIVEDSPVNAKIIDNYLLDFGFDTMFAENGEVALAEIEKKRPDLVLLDIQMPEMDGFQLCEILKNRKDTSDIPVIFMTGLTSSEDKLKGFNLGGVDYISKPFHKEEVLARVITHLKISKYQEILEREVQDRTKSLEIQMLSLNREIKERILLEREKMYLVNFLESVINSMPSTIICLDKDLNIIKWNSQAETFTGIKKTIALGNPLVEVYSPSVNYINLIKECYNTKKSLDFKDSHTGSNISVVPIESDRIPGILLRIDNF